MARTNAQATFEACGYTGQELKSSPIPGGALFSHARDQYNAVWDQKEKAVAFADGSMIKFVKDETKTFFNTTYLVV